MNSCSSQIKRIVYVPQVASSGSTFCLAPRVRYTRGNGSPSTVSKQPEIKDNSLLQCRKHFAPVALFSCLQHPAMTEILTVSELAAMLKMNKAQVYEMTPRAHS
jgi:hypothetical protein